MAFWSLNSCFSVKKYFHKHGFHKENNYIFKFEFDWDWPPNFWIGYIFFRFVIFTKHINRFYYSFCMLFVFKKCLNEINVSESIA